MGAHPSVGPAPGADRGRRSGGELEQRLRRGSRRGHRRQPYSLQTGPDRGRIGQGGDDPQATATGRAFAEVGGKHPRQQGRPAQSMAAGRSARRGVCRRRLANRLWPARCGRGPGPGAPGPRGSAGDETGAGGPEPPASPAVPSETAGEGGSHPDHGVLSAKERWSASTRRRRPPARAGRAT